MIGGVGGIKSLGGAIAITPALLTRRFFILPKRLKKFFLIKFFKRRGLSGLVAERRKKSFWRAAEPYWRGIRKKRREIQGGGV
jgi:hypothetical protein